MRRVKKYKKYSNLRELSPYIPARISRFQRPKWKFFQKKLESVQKVQEYFVNPTVKKASSKYWEKSTDYFKEEIMLRRFLLNSFDSAIKLSNLKKKVKPSSSKTTKSLLLNYLIKPLFRIDILLSRLHFFSSSYQARQFISNGLVKINGKKVKPNFSLKKGDIVTLNLLTFQNNLKFSTIFSRFLNNNLFYSFVEVDHYTKTLVILKNLDEITDDDLNLLITDYFEIYKLN